MVFEAGRNGSLFVVPKKLQKDNGNREDVQRDDIIQNVKRKIILRQPSIFPHR